MNNRFQKTFSDYNKSLAKEDSEISGELGVYLGGTKYVEVPNRSGFVYVRLRNSLSEVIQAYNDQVSATYGLPIIVVRDGTRYRVKGRDSTRYSDWGSQSSFVPIHGNQHSFNPDGGGGGDTVWTYGKQMMPMNAIPSGTNGSGNVVINPYQYEKLDGTIINIGLTGSPNLLLYKPTNNQAIMGIVYVNSDNGNPGLIINSGTPFAASITGTEEVVPYYPTVSDPTYHLVAGIRLVSGTTSIGWDNIYDLRQWFTYQITGSVGGVPAGDYITGSWDLLNGTFAASGTGGSIVTGSIATIELVTDSTGTYSTISATYVDIGTVEVSITKQQNGTDLLLILYTSLYSDSTNTVFAYGVNDGSSDYDVLVGTFNPANTHLSFSGAAKITGLSSGVQTLRARWKRTSGAGELNMDSGDTLTMTVQEVT